MKDLFMFIIRWELFGSVALLIMAILGVIYIVHRGLKDAEFLKIINEKINDLTITRSGNTVWQSAKELLLAVTLWPYTIPKAGTIIINVIKQVDSERH